MKNCQLPSFIWESKWWYCKIFNGSKIAFIEEEQVKNAEILQVLNIVQNNPSFSSTNGDNEQFKQMLTD